ncbi:MAG: hypothetical protein ACM3SP_11625 [Chloroflexota bacterium]
MGEKMAEREYQSWMSLFQPDVLAPLQYLERWRCRRRQNPEIMLMFAVLEDAVACFQKFSAATNRRGKMRFREAESWLMDKDRDGFYTFDNICDVLGLDPNYVRAGLSRWRRSRGNS